MTRISPLSPRFIPEVAILRPQTFWRASTLRLIGRFVALALILMLCAGQVFAQVSTEERSYLHQWEKAAVRAEQAIDTGRASSAAFEKLRKELTQYRQRFQEVKGANAERIDTLEGQIAALGEAPAEGKSEPEDIADLRQNLTVQLNKLRVPRMIAQEAYSRADGLIGEIDTIIRERRTRHLLERGPSPLNPELWPGAVLVLSRAGLTFWHETKAQISNDTTIERISNRLPAILALLLMGGLLILRGRPWARRMGEYLRQLGARGTGVWTFVVSLLQVILPLLGIIVLVAAVELSGILGLRGTLMLEHVPGWAFVILTFHWLGEQIFVVRRDSSAVSGTGGRLGEARLIMDALAIVLVIQDALNQFYLLENTTVESRAVLSFPLILVAALGLYRLNRIGRANIATAEAEEDQDGENRVAVGANRALSVLRRIVHFLGVVAPILAAVGYVNAAEAMIYPAISTLALFAALILLRRFLADLYAWASGQGAAAYDSLMIVAIGFVLTLLAVPVVALIWGGRVADLTELWSRFLDGFQLGDTRISPAVFLSFVVVFAIGYGATRLLQSNLRTSLLPKTKIDPGGQNAIVSGVGYVGVFLAALVAISMAGLDLSSLAIVAGALSVGIGFGLQTIVSNFVSGIILLVERPISKGDWIEVGGLMGYVRDISVRSTRIETFDRSDVIVPNSDLITGTVTNYTRGNTVGRVIVPVGVAYGTDPRRVESILREIAQSHPMVLLNPPPNVIFQGFGADSLDFEIRAILRDVNWVLSVKSDLNYEIAARFAAEEIEIPFAQRDLWLRNPEVLTGGARAAETTGGQPAPVAGGQSVQPDLDDLQVTPTEETTDSDGESDADR